jgi:hypothetical protein
MANSIYYDALRVTRKIIVSSPRALWRIRIRHKALRVTNTSNLFCRNYKKVVEDLVQVISLQEKELATKSALVADLQQQLENSGNVPNKF